MICQRCGKTNLDGMGHTCTPKAIIHICGPKLYQWEGLSFEVSSSIGPWPLKKDGDPKERAGRGFYAKVQPFMRLPEAEREKFRVGGGCQFVEVPEPGEFARFK